MILVYPVTYLTRRANFFRFPKSCTKVDFYQGMGCQNGEYTVHFNVTGKVIKIKTGCIEIDYNYVHKYQTL